MKYSKKDVLIGFVIIIIIILGAVYFKKIKNPFNKVIRTSVPTQITFKKELEDSFRYQISEDRNSIELKDVDGGNSRGIATEKEILIDADDPTTGFFYEAWLENNGNLISIGKLQLAKGGWLLEYDKSKHQDFNKVTISLEKINDNKIETRILEGSF